MTIKKGDKTIAISGWEVALITSAISSVATAVCTAISNVVKTNN